MAPVPFPKIRSVEAKPNYRLSVVWSGGRKGTIDFAPSIKRGGVFSSLSDRSLFERVKIGERSRTIEWPEPTDDLGYPVIDIDAESLMSMYMSQKDAETLQRIKGIFKSFIQKSKQTSELT